MTPKLQIGLKAAARALLPVLVAVLGLIESGALHNWRDLLTPGNVAAVLSAAGVKGLISGLTAKDVTVSS